MLEACPLLSRGLVQGRDLDKGRWELISLRQGRECSKCGQADTLPHSSECDHHIGMYAHDAFVPFARGNAITLYVYMCDYSMWVWCTLVYMQPLPVNGSRKGKTDLVPSFFLHVSVTFRCLKNVPYYSIADMNAWRCGLYFSFLSLSRNSERKKNSYHTTLCLPSGEWNWWHIHSQLSLDHGSLPPFPFLQVPTAHPSQFIWYVWMNIVIYIFLFCTYSFHTSYHVFAFPRYPMPG